MAVAAIIGAVASAAATGYSIYKQNQQAKEQEKELARQQALNEAWYNRNYYRDYLNTVEAQNAVKQYRQAWADRTRGARARQAITGGTPEQAQAVAEAGGKAMGDMIGNLAAKGAQNRSAIDTQKLAMDTNLSQQESALAAQKEQAAANLMQNGVSAFTSSLQAVGGKKDTPVAQTTVMSPDTVAPLGEVKAPDIEVPQNTTAKRPPVGGIPMKDTSLDLPKEVLSLDIPKIIPPKPIVAGNGKMAGINPDLREEEENYYSKNKNWY